jgi:hypothetical protein
MLSLLPAPQNSEELPLQGMLQAASPSGAMDGVFWKAFPQTVKH